MPHQTPVSQRLHWTRAKPGERLDENRPVVKEIARMIKADERERVLAVLRHWHPRDIIELMVQLPLKRARKLYVCLPAGPAAKILAELNDDFRTALLEDATIERITDILNSLDAEEAADALDQLPDAVEEVVVPRLRESETIAELLAYKEDSAGSIMTTKFVAVPPSWNVGQVIKEVRRNSDEIRKLEAVYVMDARRKLIGYIKLYELLLAPNDRPLEELIRTDTIAVSSDMDQEEVVRTAEKNGLTNVPVVDAEGRLLGRITADELAEVIRDEAEEDMHLIAGVSADARPDEPLLDIVKNRLPWLFAGLFGATISGSIVGSFEDRIAEAAILASFIPVVMSMAGNAGIQAATVAIQGLAAGTIWIGDLPWRLAKELLGALLNGIAAATVLTILVLVIAQFFPEQIQAPIRLALTGGLALTGVTLLAVAVGATVPLVLNHFKIDPAMATGIFVTTGNDILAVLVFFSVALLVYF